MIQGTQLGETRAPCRPGVSLVAIAASNVFVSLATYPCRQLLYPVVIEAPPRLWHIKTLAPTHTYIKEVTRCQIQTEDTDIFICLVRQVSKSCEGLTAILPLLSSNLIHLALHMH